MHFLRRDNKILFVVLLLMGTVFTFPYYTNNAQSASLYFSPSSGSVIVGQSFSLAVRVNTSGVAINAGEGSIVFDSAKLQVVSISKTSSVFTLWATEPSFSNADGTIEFAGGVPNPGYSGSNGVVVTINFKAKTATTVKGYTDIVTVSGAVLANDGEGTNVLASLGRASYYIGAAGIPAQVPTPTAIRPTPVKTPASTESLLIIKSGTHSDPEKWYSSNDPVFNWELLDGVETVSYLITDNPTSNPGTIPDGLVEQAKFTDIADGVNYFHLKFRKNGVWGPISHFKFQIDTKPPKEFNILVTDDNTNEPKLTFESSDDLSGIDHYEIQVDGKDWVIIDKALAGKLYSLNSLSYGKHEILIKAVDRAGNSTTAPATVTVPGGIWKAFWDMIRWLFSNWLFPAVVIALIASAHEFFEHSKWWKKFKKNFKLKKVNKDNTLDLRDVRKK